jgi:hypothetical protein
MLMVRRFLIRLRFMPVMGTLFDHLPTIFRWGWLYDTNTSPPGEVYVPPRQVPDDRPQEKRSS